MSVIDIIINIIMCSVLYVCYLFILGTRLSYPHIKDLSFENSYSFYTWASWYDNSLEKAKQNVHYLATSIYMRMYLMRIHLVSWVYTHLALTL